MAGGRVAAVLLAVAVVAAAAAAAAGAAAFFPPCVLSGVMATVPLRPCDTDSEKDTAPGPWAFSREKSEVGAAEEAEQDDDEGCGEVKEGCAAEDDADADAEVHDVAPAPAPPVAKEDEEEEECGPAADDEERRWASSMAARTSGCWAWYFSRWRASERKWRPQ